MDKKKPFQGCEMAVILVDNCLDVFIGGASLSNVNSCVCICVFVVPRERRITWSLREINYNPQKNRSCPSRPEKKFQCHWTINWAAMYTESHRNWSALKSYRLKSCLLGVGRLVSFDCIQERLKDMRRRPSETPKVDAIAPESDRGACGAVLWTKPSILRMGSSWQCRM